MTTIRTVREGRHAGIPYEIRRYANHASHANEKPYIYWHGGYARIPEGHPAKEAVWGLLGKQEACSRITYEGDLMRDGSFWIGFETRGNSQEMNGEEFTLQECKKLCRKIAEWREHRSRVRMQNVEASQ